MKKALIVVDAQYDFMPASKEDYDNGMGGALAVKEGDKIVPVINELLPKYDLVIFTKDWHKPDNIYFAASHAGKKPFEEMEIHGKPEVLWPIHCVQNTKGAELHDDIDFSLINGEFYIIKKGIESHCHPYGAFGDGHENTGLHEFLIEKGVRAVDIVGLALDYCVKDTAKDAAYFGYETRIFIEGTRAIAEDVNDVLLEFDDSGVVVEEFYSHLYE